MNGDIKTGERKVEIEYETRNRKVEVFLDGMKLHLPRCVTEPDAERFIVLVKKLDEHIVARDLFTADGKWRLGET